MPSLGSVESASEHPIARAVALGAEEGGAELVRPTEFENLPGRGVRGIVDGQENPIETIYAQKFHEVQKGVAMIDYIVKPAYVTISESFWQGLSDEDKALMVNAARNLLDMGFKVIATGGTADYFKAQGLNVTRVNKVLEGRPHIVDALKNGEVHLVFNTTEGAQSIKDSRSIRTTALAQKIPCITTATGARSTVRAIEAMRAGALDVAPLQSFY